MTRPPSALPPSLRDRPFTTVQARDSRVPAFRLRAADLSRPFHGVRATGDTASLELLVHAYAARMPPHELFSHTTAARIHGMRMPEGFGQRLLHVSALPPHSRPRARGVIGHRTSVSPVMVGELRVARPVDAWMQCASILSLDEMIVMGDGLLRRHSPLATRAELERRVAAEHGTRGVILLRAALEQMRPRTDSPRETTLRLLVMRAGFPEPEVNGVIRNEYGAVIAHGDLVFRAERVVLEYDGGGHREKRQYFLDIYRLDEIMEERWRVIRVDKYLLAHPAVLFAKLRKALKST